MLELEDVRVSLQGFPILRGVSLQALPGQITGLVGRNGAGKTTTLRTIMGLVPLQGGSLRLGGQDLRPLPAHRRAALGIGYMPEDRRLIGPLTVEENLLLPAWAIGLPGAPERLRWVYERMPEVAELAGRRAAQLSGGQQKLVALARALMHGTRLLLLDEPFEGLAPAMALRLREILRGLRTEGMAILVAESDLHRVSALAERIYTIERGEIQDPGGGGE
ncbi:MAG: ATP-binding cassette domain-containing protein [Thermoflexus hugenholtzii]|jgi:branched-chain amino acid transport system ATP-binding protein|uniref:ABC transporter ATP-binding protein n=1 Tax=Thermoflexus TaxID=1495649 RepID=UPI001C78F138|nr:MULTISPECIES: ATP-binding cassette domain-containing protein [Thermoflexus]QWK09269.1 MAG: ATP-binding cassette domain-containing protein [Thermoflexus hugenholtzii]